LLVANVVVNKRKERINVDAAADAVKLALALNTHALLAARLCQVGDAAAAAGAGAADDLPASAAVVTPGKESGKG
jgi:hypothetical protein